MESIEFRTDMADERVDKYKKVHNLSEIDGIKIESENLDYLKVTTVDVLNENGKDALKKEIGTYITLEINDTAYLEDEEKEKITATISEKIKGIIESNVNNIMVVGLGNSQVTPDSLGPRVISLVNVTRHMIKYAKELVKEGTREISAIAPGVLGTTGIETLEIIEEVTKIVKPDVIIAVDSLATGSVDRVGKTIQIGNTGITPGAGVGNRRKELNKKSLGVDVIAIGVPFVVDLATITNDTLEKVMEKLSMDKLGDNFKNLPKEQRYVEIAKILDTDNLMVTPKNIDEEVISISKIIADAINIAI